MPNHVAKPPRFSGNKAKATGFGKPYRFFLAKPGADGRTASGFILHRNRLFRHIRDDRRAHKGIALEKTCRILYISCPFWLDGAASRRHLR